MIFQSSACRKIMAVVVLIAFGHILSFACNAAANPDDFFGPRFFAEKFAAAWEVQPRCMEFSIIDRISVQQCETEISKAVQDFQFVMACERFQYYCHGGVSDGVLCLMADIIPALLAGTISHLERYVFDYLADYHNAQVGLLLILDMISWDPKLGTSDVSFRCHRINMQLMSQQQQSGQFLPARASSSTTSVFLSESELRPFSMSEPNSPREKSLVVSSSVPEKLQSFEKPVAHTAAVPNVPEVYVAAYKMSFLKKMQSWVDDDLEYCEQLKGNGYNTRKMSDKLVAFYRSLKTDIWTCVKSEDRSEANICKFYEDLFRYSLFIKDIFPYGRNNCAMIGEKFFKYDTESLREESFLALIEEHAEKGRAFLEEKLPIFEHRLLWVSGTFEDVTKAGAPCRERMLKAFSFAGIRVNHVSPKVDETISRGRTYAQKIQELKLSIDAENVENFVQCLVEYSKLTYQHGKDKRWAYAALLHEQKFVDFLSENREAIKEIYGTCYGTVPLEKVLHDAFAPNVFPIVLKAIRL